MHGMGYFRSARNMIRIPCQIYDCTHGKIDFPGLQHIISSLMHLTHYFSRRIQGLVAFFFPLS
jgi:hypothetical protein